MLFFSSMKCLPWQRLFRFVITGGSALAIDVAIYFVLTRFGEVNYLVSRTVSLGVAIVWSFSINRYWTFEATAGRVRKQAMRFFIVIISTSLLSLGLMHLGVSSFHLNDILVLLSVSVFTTLINFSAHYFWSYAQQDV